MSQIDDFLDGNSSAQQTKSQIDSFLDAAPEPGFTARLGQGASRALDSAKTALTDDPKKIAKIAADQARTALPQTPLQQQLADEFKPYVDAANKAEGFVDNVTAWGAAGLKRAGQLLSNPAEAGKMIAEQLPNSLPGIAGGFVGAKAGAALGTAVAPGLGTVAGGIIGGIAGGFAGSYGLEKGAAMQEQVQQEAQKRKIDIQNQDAVAGMVAQKQPEFEATAQRKGVGTAGTDAILNVATMGLAGVGGRAIAKEAQALHAAVKSGAMDAAEASTRLAALESAQAARNTLGAKALRGTGVVGAEMVGEGLSEAAGQQYAYGQVDAGQVIDESLLGLGSGGAMALGSKTFNKAAGIVDQDATTQRLAAASAEIERQQAGTQPQQSTEVATTNAGSASTDAPPLALGNTPDPLISFPDGSVGRQSEVEKYINDLPEDQRVAARAKLMGYAPQPVQRPHEAMGLDPAAGPLSRIAVQAVDSGAYMPPAGQAPATAPEPDPVVLQNRDRTSAASIAQMQEIAANPDYLRVGPSRDMTSGAPVVFGELPPTALLGRPETVVDGHGQRMGTQYAVVDALDLIASNNADGTTVAEYATGAPGKLRSVAGNGRTAGLQAAYQMGTAQRYRQELAGDAAALGVDAQALATMQRPVLVRVMQGADVTRDMGDRTNITATQKLSPLEQAGNDARRLDVGTLAFDEGGNPTPDSIKGFVSAMPVAERGDMLNPDGTPTRQAVDRLMAATFKQAYESDELVQLYAQATDPDARAVMAAAADASGVLANLKGAGEFDVRGAVADAAKMAVNAARQGLKLSDVLQNQDLDMSPEAYPVAAYLAQHIRTPKKMAEGLRRWGQLALEQARIADENTHQGSLLGPRPTLSRPEIFARLGSEANPTGQGIAPAAPAPQPAPEQAALVPAPQSPQSNPNGEPNGPQADQAQQAAPQQSEAPAQATAAAVARHPTWRQNAIQAGRVALALGLEPKGKRLAQIVAEIDARDSEQNQVVAPANPAQAATENVAPKPTNLQEGIAAAQAKAQARPPIPAGTKSDPAASPASPTHTKPKPYVLAMNQQVPAQPPDVSPSKETLRAAASIPTFQGGKTKMARAITEKVRRHWGSDAAKIDTIIDYFGGSGSWGAYMAGAAFPNVKRLVIHEFNPERLHKIRLFNERGNQIEQLLAVPEVKAYFDAVKRVIQKKRTFSGSAIANVVASSNERVALRKAARDAIGGEAFNGLLQAVEDQGSASFGLYGKGKSGADAVNDILRRVTDNAGKAYAQMQALRERGVAIEYVTGNSYEAAQTQGKNVLAMVDPPYYATKGYNGVSLVDMATYNETRKLLDRLQRAGNSVIYTDEAWWEKHDKKTGDTVVPPDVSQQVDGLDAFGQLSFIQELMGNFFRMPIATRMEVVGFINGNRNEGNIRRGAHPDNRQTERGREAGDNARSLDSGAGQQAGSRVAPGNAGGAQGLSADADARLNGVNGRNTHPSAGGGVSTARNSSLMAQIRAGSNSTALLEDVAKNSESRAFRALAKAIIAKGLPFPVRVDAANSAPDFVAHYNPDAHMVEVAASMPYDLEQVLLHEAVHAVTTKYLRGIGRTSDLGKEVASLLNQAKAHAQKTASSFYGITDEHEFLAEVMTNRDFAMWLDGIPASTETVLSKLVSAVAKFFGVAKANVSLAGQAMSAFERVMLEQSALSRSFAKGRSKSKTGEVVAKAYGVTFDEEGDGVTYYFGEAEVVVNHEIGAFAIAGNEFTADYEAARVWATNSGLTDAGVQAASDISTDPQLTDIERHIMDAYNSTGDWMRARDMAAYSLKDAGIAAKWSEIVKANDALKSRATKHMKVGAASANPGQQQNAPMPANAAPDADTANYAATNPTRPGTAQDKAVMRAIADGKSARDVLRLIANGSKDPFRRQVARLLLKSGITPNIEFGHIGKTKDGTPIYGQYRGKTDTIAIAGSAEYAAERIFMHEAMHAATMRALAKGGLARVQLQKLMSHVQKQKGAVGFYGMQNVDEFVAEVFTNPDFQNALRGMSAPAGNSLKSAWDGFVRILRGILGLPNDSLNALSQALELGVEAVRQDMALRKQGAQAGRNANAGRDAIDQTETENFKRWFGDSKVVDAEGKPLVVYHGTNADFSKFDVAKSKRAAFGLGFYFTSAPNSASQVATVDSSIVMPVYLSITNPASILDFYHAMKEVNSDQFSSDRQVDSGAEITKNLISKGFDGVIIGDDFVVFRPEQIKSATGNNGNFDPANPDIRYSNEMSPDLARAILALGSPPKQATKESVRAAVRELVNGLGLLPNRLGRIVVATSAEIKQDWEPLIGPTGMEASGDAGRAQGFYDPKSKTVFLIADNIRQGDELGVVAHELMHKHGPAVLGEEGWNRLHGALGGWAKAKAGSMERIVYDEAARRVRASGPELSTQELFPYAVQVALEMGVRPNAVAPQGTVERWLGQVRAALRQVWSKIVGGKGDFNSLDLVNLAFGIAQRENPEHAGELDGAVGAAKDNLLKPGDPMFSRAAPTAKPGAAGWAAPSASQWDDFVYKLQDKHIDTKRVLESIRATGKAIADDLDVYLQEELYHGRAAKRTQDFVSHELEPLMKYMADSGLKMQDVQDYLHARHAKEANRVVAQRNPGLPDGGSGMTDAEADAVLASFNAIRRAQLERAAARVDAMIAGTRQAFVEYGLESQDTVDGWAKTFAHYVPLMREQDGDGMAGLGTGQGFSIKGREVKGRTGSTRKVVDILANIAMQRERAIVRGEKNRVATALVGLAKDSPSALWQVDVVPTRQTLDKKTGMVTTQHDPLYKQRDNVVVAKIPELDKKTGKVVVKEHAVVFNEGDARAMRMATALKNLDAPQLEGLLGATAQVTRYLAAINTQYNPIFGVTNLARDVQGAALNLAATPLAGKRREVLGQTLSALAGIYADERARTKGKGGTASPWAQLWEEFQSIGGQTGYRDQFRTSADRGQALAQALDPSAWTETKWGQFFTAGGRLKVPMEMARKAMAPVFAWLDDYNTAMENGVRLAAYKTARDAGMSKERAASLAKNLTTNFNRKGQSATQVGALYAFFNASVQGTARIGQTLFDMDPGQPKTLRLSSVGKKIVAGGVLLGSMQALLLAAAGFDDEEPPDFVRERNLVIPTGGKKYLTIPMPLGFHVLPNLGRIPTEFVLSGFSKPAESAMKLLGLFSDTFNPIGNAGLSMQTLAPTVLDPLAALAENKDFSGRAIAKESFNKMTPGHALARDTASLPALWLAEGINYLTGGTRHVRGALSPTPDQIDYLVGQVTGGVGREATKAMQTAQATASGDDLPAHKVPLLGRFYGNADSPSAKQAAFYRYLDEVARHAEQVKGLRLEGKGAEALAYAQEHPQARLHMAARAAQRQIKDMRERRRELEQQGASREEVRALEQRMTQRMERFNALAAP